ncbi:MAG: N-acetylglucosamine kinase [Clostridia bacterium]|nr:N-acetylglucosamine kinase [Clostridia bacterium]
MMRYVFGVDGGGTKTHCALFDIEGNEIDIIHWGPTSHEVLKGGFKELKSELALILNYILRKNNIEPNQIIKGVFGLAGVDTDEQHNIVSGMITELGFKDFILCNDAFLCVKAGSPEGYGVGIINGTGCCVAGIDSRGKMLQIGGLGHLTGDIGGGTGLGEYAVRAGYNYLFRCGEYTCIADLLFKELKIDSKYDLINNIHKKTANGEIKISDLNRLVFEAANMGDDIAISILEKVGEELAASASGALKELEFGANRRIPIVLAGSINLKGSNPALVNKLKMSIASKNPDKEVDFIMLERPPVIGAAIWALESILSQREIHANFFRGK